MRYTVRISEIFCLLNKVMFIWSSNQEQVRKFTAQVRHGFPSLDHLNSFLKSKFLKVREFSRIMVPMSDRVEVTTFSKSESILTTKQANPVKVT